MRSSNFAVWDEVSELPCVLPQFPADGKEALGDKQEAVGSKHN